MSDELDEAPNCYRFRRLSRHARQHGQASPPDGRDPFAPIMTVFGDIFGRAFSAARPSSIRAGWPSIPELAATNRALPYLTLRLAVIANAYFDTTSCVSMIREEHTAFYKRVFGSVPVCEPRLYPPFTMPIHFYESRCDTEHGMDTVRASPSSVPRHGTAAALRALPVGEPAPLTVLPTARYSGIAA
jgi:hypothetical protein